MEKITSDDIQYKLDEINSFIAIRYKMGHHKKERDWRAYEHEYSTRIKTAIKDLDPLIQESISSIKIKHGPGHPYSLPLDQRVKPLLIKQLIWILNSHWQ
jgi:hypothetical protein